MSVCFCCMSFVCDICVDVGLGCEWRIRDVVLNVTLVKVGFECECWCLFKGGVVFV